MICSSQTLLLATFIVIVRTINLNNEVVFYLSGQLILREETSKM